MLNLYQRSISSPALTAIRDSLRAKARRHPPEVPRYPGAAELDRLIDEQVEQEPDEGAAHRGPRPLGEGQDPSVAGVIPQGQVADGAEEVSHRSPEGGQDRCRQGRSEAADGRAG